MGIVSIASRETKKYNAIKRLKKNESKPLTTGVPIIPFFGSHERGLSKLKFTNIKDLSEKLKCEVVHHQEKTIDLIWQMAWHFSTRESPRPNWQGFMQTAAVPQNSNDPFSKASVKFLPIIDLSSSDETCLYSTLLFIKDEAKKQKIEVPCVTFDQPLWQKAVGIVEDKNLDIVCRLGGFHTFMSFLGSVGKVMMGSGLEELFEEVYSEDTVKHMISGKAYARSLRAHLMTQSALVEHLVEIMEDEGKLPPSENFKSCYSKLLEGALSNEDLEEFWNGEHAQSFNEEMQKLTSRLRKDSRTAKLWIQYIDYVNIMKDYIIAERTSDWQLHLATLSKMLNLFAATGHIHYARSARMYIQQMSELSSKYPYLFNKFSSGHHAVRRSSRYWAGLWSDLVIEQTLMRSIKSRGGLTRGRGMEENVRQLWVSSMSYCAAVHDAMTSLTGVKVQSSDQHQEMGFSRIKTDFKDSLKFFCWLEKRNPFVLEDAHLHSLSSGVIAVNGQDNVNCDEAEVVGEMIQRSLDGKSFTNASIKRKDEVKSLAAIVNSVNVDDETIAVDSTSLFTRLAAVAQREEDVEKYFEYELTQFPEALFNRGLMRKPDKASLRNTILTEGKERNTILTEEKDCHPHGKYVIDGGALIHRVNWKKGMAFKEIARNHVSYVRSNYGSCYIVFDGYNNPTSIKANEHQRRQKTHGSCPDIEIFPDNESKYNRERFLSNWKNKQQLIAFITDYLRLDGQNVHICEGDADTKIVSTALEVSNHETTTVVADDTDVAVMLAYHWTKELKPLLFLSERTKKCWDIGACQEELAVNKEHLLFIHAWTGCDSTSAICGKGKVSFFNLMKKSEVLREVSEIFSDFWSSKEQIYEASIDAFLELYCGKPGMSLSSLR